MLQDVSLGMDVRYMDKRNTKMETYFNTKDIAKRNALLKQLVFDLPENKEFFSKSI